LSHAEKSNYHGMQIKDKSCYNNSINEHLETYMPLNNTLNALSNAINDGQLDQIQEILQDRDAHGFPHIDINAGTPSILHQICFLGGRTYGPRIEQARIREMFEYVLNLRDNYGNPIANPNVMHCNAGNIITAIVDLNDIYLLQLVLDLRTNQGEMVANIYAGAEPGHFWSPLRRAVYSNKIDMVRALVDARKADGTPLLTVAQINTDLRGATSNQFGPGAYVTSNECTNYLTQYLRDRNTQPPTNAVQQRQAPVIQAAVQPIATENQFDADQQNTHDPSVTQTARGSLLALNITYSSSLNEERCFEEIKAFICDYDYSTVLNTLANKEKKDGAEEFLNLLQSRFTTTHSYTGYTIKKVLALVWMGIKDNNIAVFPEEIRRTFQPSTSVAPPEIINTKKSSFIEKFIEASREYKERGKNMDICAGGSIHKLLEALNHAHINVVITTGAQSVKPAANEMALAIVGLQLRTKELDVQNHILSNWDADNDTTTSEFKKSITTSVDQGLKNHFGTLLTENDRGEIVNCLPDMPRPPVPHKELNELVTTITNTVQKTGTPSRIICVTALHKLACEIYLEQLTDEEKYQNLNSEYEAFKQLDKLMEKIDKEAKVNKEEIITSIKSTLEEQDKSLLEKYNYINLKYSAFILLSKFDPYLKKLDTLKEKTSNSIHKNKLELFHEKIDQCAILFKENLMGSNVDIVELTTQLNDAVQDHINTVKNDLENEPGIWRNLNPIIKGILGVLAVLLVLPAIIVHNASTHGFTGTFFKTPKTEVTEEFEKKKLDVHPKDDFSENDTPAV